MARSLLTWFGGALVVVNLWLLLREPQQNKRLAPGEQAGVGYGSLQGYQSSLPGGGMSASRINSFRGTPTAGEVSPSLPADARLLQQQIQELTQQREALRSSVVEHSSLLDQLKAEVGKQQKVLEDASKAIDAANAANAVRAANAASPSTASTNTGSLDAAKAAAVVCPNVVGSDGIPATSVPIGMGAVVDPRKPEFWPLVRAPLPDFAKFDPAGTSTARMILDKAKWENANVHFTNVAIQNRKVLLNNVPANYRSKFEVKGLPIRVISDGFKCTETLEGPIFFFMYQTIVNLFHIHNDNLIPLYRMMHDMGYGEVDPNTPRPRTTIILGGSNEMVAGPELPFFRWALGKMADRVLDLAAIPNGQTICTPHLRAGRPHRFFRIFPRHMLYYEQHNLGVKYIEFMRARAKLPRRAASWPPNVALLQRSRGFRYFAEPEILQKGWDELNIKMQVIRFDGNTRPEEACRIMSEVDILIAVHGAGDSNMMYLADNGVFVQILPHNLPQWEVAMMRRLAAFRHLGYVDFRSKGDGEGTGWKVGEVRMTDDPYEYNMLVIDTMMEYARLNPHLKPLMNRDLALPHKPHSLSYGPPLPRTPV